MKEPPLPPATNPAPVKAGLAALGHGTGEVRLPLVPISAGTRAQLLAALEGLKPPGAAHAVAKGE